MSHRATTYVKELRVSPAGELLTKTEKLVLYALADYHQDKMGVNTYPSVMTLAEESLMDERSCRRILDSLERKGVLERQRGAVTGRGHLTFYRFCELDRKAASESVISIPNKQISPAQKEGTVSPFIFAERGAKGGQKGGKSLTPPIELTGTETKTNTNTPPYPPQAGGGGFEKERASDEATTEKSADGVATHNGITGAAIESAGSDSISAKPWRDSAGNESESRDEMRILSTGGEIIDDTIDHVMHACGFTKRRLRVVIRDVLRQEVAESDQPLPIALACAMTAMVDAWEDFSLQGERLRFKWGASGFFGEGYWRNRESWPWNAAVLERERVAAQASVGSWR